MNYIKTIVIIPGFLALFLLGAMTVTMVKNGKGGLTTRSMILFIVCLCITVGSFVLFGKYLYPFQQALTPKLYKVLEVSGKQLMTTYRPPWHSAYEAYGLWPESFNFCTTEPVDNYNWPTMDFKHHTYVIVYGQEIETLSYNVWDQVDYPFRTGAYYGHMVLREEFHPNKVFIYELSKIRIDNDWNRDYIRPNSSYTDHSKATFYQVAVSLYIFVLAEVVLFLRFCKYYGKKKV